MNPTKNLIETKLYMNPTENLIELKFYIATFNNISVISWWSVILVEEKTQKHLQLIPTRVYRKN